MGKVEQKNLCATALGLVSLISDHFKVLIKALGFLPRKHTSRQFFADKVVSIKGQLAETQKQGNAPSDSSTP